MYQVVKKLKYIKSAARKLMWKNGNLHDRVKVLRVELDAVQNALDKNPDNSDLRLEESALLKAFNDACFDEELFLQKKAKIKWLKEGDGNTGYFHNVVKGKRNRSRIMTVETSNGLVVEGDAVADAFVNHYEKFLGQAERVEGIRDC